VYNVNVLCNSIVDERVAFCTDKSYESIMSTMEENWKIWASKILKKAMLETRSRNNLFPKLSSTIDNLASKSPEELVKCESCIILIIVFNCILRS